MARFSNCCRESDGYVIGLFVIHHHTDCFFEARLAAPLVPRAIFGILNTLLFFPSGAIYPIQAFPAWLRAIAICDPFTYAVHGLKSLLLKQTGLGPVLPDMLYLAIFATVTLSLATPLFKRTL